MKKLHKLVAGFCSCVMLLSSFTFVSSVFAADESGLYISTTECPQTVVDYAKREFNGMNFENYGITSNSFLGMPFVVAANNDTILYYFPIMNENKKVVLTYRVFEDVHSYAGIVSKALVDELSGFIGNTTLSKPAKVFVNKKNDIIIQSSTRTEIVDVNPVDSVSTMDDAVPAKRMNQQVRVKDVLEIIDTNTGNRDTLIKTLAVEPRESRLKNLNVTIRETQTTLPWCTGYVTAMIVSYKTGGAYYARDVASYLGVGTTGKISLDGAVRFGKSKGLNPRVTLFDVSNNSLRSHIDKNSPVLISGVNVSNKNDVHAYALVGYYYDTSSNAIQRFLVWNPWYHYFESMGTNQIYVTPSGVRYESEGYVINW